MNRYQIKILDSFIYLLIVIVIVIVIDLLILTIDR